MKLLVTLLLSVVCLVTSCKNESSNTEKATIHGDMILESSEIPESMVEAILYLDAMFTDEEKRKIQLTLTGKADPFDEKRFFNVKALGMNLRNDWGLWKKSKLKDYFVQREITHADWIISAIFEGWSEQLKTGSFDEKTIISKYAEIEADWIARSGDPHSYENGDNGSPNPFDE